MESIDFRFRSKKNILFGSSHRMPLWLWPFSNVPKLRRLCLDKIMLCTRIDLFNVLKLDEVSFIINNLEQYVFTLSCRNMTRLRLEFSVKALRSIQEAYDNKPKKIEYVHFPRLVSLHLVNDAPSQFLQFLQAPSSKLSCLTCPSVLMPSTFDISYQ